MAAYTAVVTLMQDLEDYLTSYGHSFGSSGEEGKFCPFTEEEIQNLYDAVSLMDSLLRDSSGLSYNRQFINQIPEQRIVDAVHKARDFVDFWAVECLPGRWWEPPSILGDHVHGLTEILDRQVFAEQWSMNMRRRITQTLTEVTSEIFSINKELEKKKKIRGNRGVPDLEVNSSFLGSLKSAPNTEGKLVGLEKDLVTMLDSLTGQPSRLKVCSIIGMGGIGKTTFSRKLYDDPLVVHHFYVRVWVAVSQQYQVRDLLLGVLRCITSVTDGIDTRSNEELREQVYRILKGKRYLVVLDDMWETKAWDELRITFPDDKNGSRVMLTSRLREVALHASQGTPPHSLRCLSAHESWKLLSSKIFGDESCPLELVEIGKQIAYKCQGLPLAIVVVGGLLSRLNTKLDVWQEVAQSVCSVVMEEAEHCQNILALSYHHLPDQLKACFLYMGIFPEDYEISVKKLIWLWIAEGFIRPSVFKSLEEVAEDYLEDLTTRSLIMVKKIGSNGRIKTCYIHDMMRELCLRESRKQNFLHVINSSEQLPPMNLQGDHNMPRLSFHSSIGKFRTYSFPCTRSIICFEKLSCSGPQRYFPVGVKLLRVLDILNIHQSTIPDDMDGPTLLKFMALTVEDLRSHMWLFTFRSLQILILDSEWDGYLPRMFWDMLELRHFQLKRSCLSYQPASSAAYFQSPSTSTLGPVYAKRPLRVLNNLKSVSTIRPISCTEKIFLSMPDLKKLGIYETEEDHQFRGWFRKLACLRQLETLKYVFSNPFVSSVFKPYRLPSWNNFPPKLVKLTLSGTSLPWDDMLKLSMLPKLEVLKLRNYAFLGVVWKSKEGGFCCLRYLLIGSTNLEIWEADGTHFPNLHHLVLRHCRSLKEIPYGIAEAPLLEKIELHCCKDSAAMSARHLQEEQQNLGNDGLIIRITEG